jgi:hypothetical protein
MSFSSLDAVLTDAMVASLNVGCHVEGVLGHHSYHLTVIPMAVKLKG